MALPKFDSKTFAAAALAGLMTVTPAFADDVRYAMSDDRSDIEILDMTVRAKMEALENGNLGLVINHGPITGDPHNQIVSPEEFSGALEEALVPAKIELKTYYLLNPKMG